MSETNTPDFFPLYGKSGILDKKHVICVENENSVHAVSCAAGINEENIGSVTNQGDISKIEDTDWGPLAGKTVYLWPNNEALKEKGQRYQYMVEIQKKLRELKPVPKIFWINPNELDIPVDGDAVAFFDKYETQERQIDQLHAIMANSKLAGPVKGVKLRIDDAISGKRETIGLPWPLLSSATQALKPGTVTLLCGDGGAAKSLCLLQCCVHWHFNLGCKIALYELEEDRTYHLMRALAQRSGQPNIMDEEWVKDNPDESIEIFDKNKDFLDYMGKLIHEAPVEALTLVQLAKWVEEQAKAGKRIIEIVTKVQG